jgi:glutamate racemase
VADNRPIGVFDSGVGGLTVVRKAMEILPNESIIYLGDTARVPYGNKTPGLIRLYSQQCARFLLAHDVKLIVVACNTASAVALNTVQEISPVPVIGVITPAAKMALSHSPNGNIGIIGTRTTVRSKAYDADLWQMSEQRRLTVQAAACPLFVPLVEEGMEQHPATRAIAADYLRPFKESPVDVLILGCTHFPLLAEVIQQELPDTTLINSGEAAVSTALGVLNSINARRTATETPRRSFYVTDFPDTFPGIANRFLGVSGVHAEQVSIEELSTHHDHAHHD